MFLFNNFLDFKVKMDLKNYKSKLVLQEYFDIEFIKCRSSEKS